MMEEQLIIHDFIAGNETAFKLIYNHYSDLIYVNIHKIIGSPVTAQDILQDVFTTLWVNREKINPGESVGNWLFVVSYNSSISYLKKRLRESIDFVEDVVSNEIVENPESKELIYSEQVARLQDAINRLPLHKQRAFSLYHFENKSYEEIAKELNLSVSSVKFYIKQSKSFIRQYVHKNLTYIAGASILLFILEIH